MLKRVFALMLVLVMFVTVGCNSAYVQKGDDDRSDKHDKDDIINSEPNNPSGSQSGQWPGFTTPSSGAEDPEPSVAPSQPVQTNPVATQPMEPTEPTEPDVQCYQISIWVSEAIVDLTYAQIQEFNETNTYGIYFDASVAGVSEYDAASMIINDVESAPDLFTFAQDCTARLVQAGALTQLGYNTSIRIRNENTASSIDAVIVGDDLYGYPMTADNGYFMYYDKSVISESDVDSLEALIAACEASGCDFSFELENSWYIASFFFATGCVSEWEVDTNGEFVGLYDTFNSPSGLIAAKGMQKLLTSSCYKNSSFATDFGAARRSAVVVSGTWNYVQAKSYLGDNLGVADLPSFTVDGQSYHLSSFSGCKIMGVKPQSDAQRIAALNLLAQYLTGEECQLERFEYTSWGPSNLAAQQDPEVLAAPHLQALFQQNEYAVPQGQIYGAWWDIARVIATEIKDGVTPETALQHYQESLNGLFISPEDRYAWSVIGAIGGDLWCIDWPMEEQADGTWKSVNCFDMEAGTELKVRQGKSWDVNYGADGVRDGNNFRVEVAGTYYVLFDPATGIISLLPA